MQKTVAKNNQDTFLKRLLRTDEMTTFIPLFAIIVITTIFRPDFLSARNFGAMFTQIPFLAICCLGAAFPLMSGAGADISTGRVAGFAGIIMGALIYNADMNPALAIIIALLACMCVGLFNGFLSVHLGIPTFVATMAMLYIVGGARFLFIQGYELALARKDNFFLDDFFDGRYLGMPIYFWIMLLLFVVLFIIVKKTVWGRNMLAVGDNAEVAHLCGINSKKMQMEAFTLCSLLAGIAGIVFTLDTALAQPETGDGWEFRAIAGCVVGGVSLSGGKCSPLGILIGITLVFVAENAIIFLGLPSTLREAVKGVLMAGAVLFDIFRNSRKVSE